MTDFAYEGRELDDFARAANWKAYWMGHVREYLRGSILEVGAGIGSNTMLLCVPEQHDWVCLEPDARSADTLRKRVQRSSLAESVTVITGAIHDLDRTRLFDAVLYVDVLEHIEDDAGELRGASALLKPGGRLIVLSPAYQFLYSPFDASIGHHRRYHAGTIRAFELPGLVLERVRYLDSAGLLASLGNRLLLRQSLPTERQIAFWDGFLVPCSRVVDRLLGFRTGKSLLAIWKMGDARGRA